MSTAQYLPEAHALAALYPYRNERHRDTVNVPQMQHRLDLIKFWGIKEADKVLEIGCGQGDCTIALAHAIGETGHVTALDPASQDYGSPFTLGQAQSLLKATSLGSRMTFIEADPLAYLQGTTERYSVAVIAHCIWYFSSPSYLAQLLCALKGHVDRICVAEYALTASDSRSVPHVLAALAQASLECRKPTSTSNVRTVLSPAAIHDMAAAAGLRQEKQHTFTPNEGMLDGSWEVSAVLDSGFVSEIEKGVTDEREKAVVFASRDAVRANVELVKAKGATVKTMDVWQAVYQTS